jgi:hypothetical protein
MTQLATTAIKPTPPAPPPAPAADPVLAALERIERRLAEVERVTSSLAPLVDAAPGGVAMLTDTLDTVAAGLADRGVELDARLRSAIRALEVSTSPRAVHGLAALVESRLLDPSALAVLSRFAAALAEPGPTPPVGAWGLLRALRDPDVQRALGFLLGVTRELGRHLDTGELEECRRHLLAATTEAP